MEPDCRARALTGRCRIEVTKLPLKRYESEKDWGVACLALEMYMTVGPEDKNLLLGDMAEDLATAFGVSPDMFKNLEASWRENSK